MENEENRGLINKKAYEDQWVGLGQFIVGSLSHYSLSHGLGHLYFSWITLGGCGILGFLEQESKGKAGSRNEASGSETTLYFLASL